MTEQQIQQMIGQLDASIDKVEAFLDTNSFQEFCDNTYSNISYLRQILKEVKQQDKEDKDEH